MQETEADMNVKIEDLSSLSFDFSIILVIYSKVEIRSDF